MAKLKKGEISKRSSIRLLDSRVGRDSLPRYRRVDVKTYEGGAHRSTVYAFHMQRVPHWVIVGKGWVSNMSDIDFVDYYEPSNAEARRMMECALESFGPAALEVYHIRTAGRRLVSRRGKD